MLQKEKFRSLRLKTLMQLNFNVPDVLKAKDVPDFSKDPYNHYMYASVAFMSRRIPWMYGRIYETHMKAHAIDKAQDLIAAELSDVKKALTKRQTTLEVRANVAAILNF